MNIIINITKIKHTALIILYFSLAILNTGCAVTYMKNEYQASYMVNGEMFDEGGVPNLHQHDGKSISMSTNCGSDRDRDHVYSFMMSPIIPLPPVIPILVFPEYSRISLGLHGEGFTVTDPTISIAYKGRVFEMKGAYERPYSKTDIAWIYWHNPNGLSCMELDNSTMSFSGIHYNGEMLKLNPVKINVKDMGLNIGFEYYDQ